MHTTENTLSFLSEDDGPINSEILLLMLAGGFIGVNFLALFIQEPNVRYLIHFAGWLASAIGGYAVLRRYLPGHDPLIFPVVMFITGWGLVLIGRLIPAFADRQAVWLLLSTLALLLAACFPHLLRWLRNYRYLLLLLGLGLLVSTILLGQNPSGDPNAPQLWLGIGNVFFQPSEALKVILVAFLASYLAEQYPLMRLQQSVIGGDDNRVWLSPHILGPILLMWSLSVLVLIWQRDLGTAALFFAVFILLLYIASGQFMILLGGFLLTIAAGIVAYNLFAVVQLRVDIWLNPWPEANGRAYQIVQSLMAFSEGGIFGQGIGQGAPTFIPVVHSDFIFSALAEEYGLLGVVVLLVTLATLVMRGLRLSVLLQTRSFYALLAIGLSLLIGIQSLLIMGGVLKLFPLTGVTFPYLSYGGSSLLMSFIVAGLLLRLSTEVN